MPFDKGAALRLEHDCLQHPGTSNTALFPTRDTFARDSSMRPEISCTARPIVR